MKIRVAGIDPALANMGIARMILDTETEALTLESLALTQTVKLAGKHKTVRQNSDDLRRAVELTAAFQAGIRDCTVCFAEVPSGSQHSRSALGFGIAIGVLAGSTIPLIEVMPAETKAAIGDKTATKRQIIDWAMGLYPDGAWLVYDRNGRGFAKGDPHADNEHLADACAIVHAGIKTPEFKRLLAMWRANPVPA